MSIHKSERNGLDIREECIRLNSAERGGNLERNHFNSQGNRGPHSDKRILFTFVGYNRYEEDCNSSAGLGVGLRGINFNRGKLIVAVNKRTLQQGEEVLNTGSYYF